MLKEFSVKNFKGFKDKITLHLGTPNNYEFQSDIIEDGCITKGIICGINGSGKSNLGLALFDIISHLSDKETILKNYFIYQNIENKKDLVEFEYVFRFFGHKLSYQYKKEDWETVVYEELVIDGEVKILYDAIKKEGYTKLSGSETLNDFLMNTSGMSRVRYVDRNTILEDNIENQVFKAFIHFVDRMLLFYSVDEKGYEGLQVGVESLSEGIISNGKLKDFEHFLRENEVDYKLKAVEIDGEKKIYCSFGEKAIDLFKIASTGTKSLALFYYWYIKFRKASFVFIDEFDAFYHFRVAENLVKKVREVKGVQIFMTTHNTDLMSNDLLRPDCYFEIKNNKILSFSNKTEKELRKAHNLQKMYKAGAFNEEGV